MNEPGMSLLKGVFVVKRFAESCPYFDLSDSDKAEKALRNLEVDDWVKAQLLREYDAEHFVLFKSCLSSFIFHRQWLDENTHTSNAIHDDTPCFTGLHTDVLYIAAPVILT